MHIKNSQCPRCGASVVVDGGLYDIGTVRLRCPTCAHYFLPEGSPQSRTVQQVANTSVNVTIWEPEDTNER